MNILTLLPINWSPDPELFNPFGSILIRYYGLSRVVSIASAYAIVYRQYHDQKAGEKTFKPSFFYCFFGTPIGARLGHCLFYQLDYYLDHFWETILPVRFLPDGGWKWTGYEGLASHGGTLGSIISLWMYCRKTKMYYMDILDTIVVATPTTACCVRLASLMNSEITGIPTNVPWAFVFERVDMLSRHLVQLYEAIAYFIFFLGMVYLYKRGQKKQESKLETDFNTTRTKSIAVQAVASLPYYRDFLFGPCPTEVFVFRFFIEFPKEDQADFEKTVALSTGQWLSVPFILIGAHFMCFYGKKTVGK